MASQAAFDLSVRTFEEAAQVLGIFDWHAALL
jgi:hypothetical protein